MFGAGDKITIAFIMFAELRRAGGKITVLFIGCSEPGTKSPLLLYGVRSRGPNNHYFCTDLATSASWGQHNRYFYRVFGAGDKITSNFYHDSTLQSAGDKITVTFIGCLEPGTK